MTSKRRGKPHKPKFSSTQEVVELAEQCIDLGDLSGAVSAYEAGLRQFGEQAVILEGYGEALVNIGEIEKAKQLFTRAITILPNSGSVKYLNMGQLTSGEEAVQYFKKALEILYKERTETTDEEALEELCGTIASCLCSLADNYLANENLTECERVITEARKIAPDESEPLLLASSLKLLQKNRTEAHNLLTESYSKWNDPDKSDEKRPPFLSQLNTAKLFIELEDFRTAADVLENLITQQDNFVEVWVLLASAYSKFDVKSAIDSIETAKNLLLTLEEADPEMESEVLEMEKQIRALPLTEDEDEIEEKETEMNDNSDEDMT